MAISCLFYRDCSDGNTLTFAGDQAEMAAFADWLEMFSAQPLGALRAINAQEGFDPREGTEAVVLLADAPKSAAVVTHAEDRITVTWHLSPSGCLRAAEVVRDLSNCSLGKGHQYLEDAGDVVIVVSMNEWNGTVWKASLRNAIGR